MKTLSANYYTYAYLREDGSPYYVGKGSGDRIFSNIRSIHKPSNISRIVFLRENMTEKESFDNEVEMIKLWGRKNLGNGLLRNMTDGGEGVSGHKHTEEHKKNMSLSHLGKKYRQRQGGMRRRNMSEETKAKIRLAITGRKHTEESKAKMRMAKGCEL